MMSDNSVHFTAHLIPGCVWNVSRLLFEARKHPPCTGKEQVRREALGSNSHQSKHALDLVNKPDFHVFYSASTLIVIYSKFTGPFVVADCWLAAENLILAACSKGLGTCVISFAVSVLNTPGWKVELNIPAEMTAIAPIIVGVPAGETPPVPRNQPEILTWK